MTHVACPLCGRWNSAKRFPAGPGTDIFVAQFQGLGRAKGFRLLGRSSGLDDEDLCRAVKAKVLAILQTLASHGFVVPEDVLKAIGMGDVAGSLREAQAAAEQWKKKAHHLADERRYYEVEIDRLERQAKAEQGARQEMEAQLANLNPILSGPESQRDQAHTAIHRALRKLRVVARDVEYGAMLEEALSGAYEKLEEAIDILEDAAPDEDRDDAWGGDDA